MLRFRVSQSGITQGQFIKAASSVIDFHTNKTTDIELYLRIQELKQTALQSGRVQKEAYLHAVFADCRQYKQIGVVLHLLRQVVVIEGPRELLLGIPRFLLSIGRPSSSVVRD
ncbi:hypothetical protein NL676_034807 [Syzygium grande]|nr:hypothetical protein NL676_034807 [Syzygium grande]